MANASLVPRTIELVAGSRLMIGQEVIDISETVALPAGVRGTGGRIAALAMDLLAEADLQKDLAQQPRESTPERPGWM